MPPRTPPPSPRHRSPRPSSSPGPSSRSSTATRSTSSCRAASRRSGSSASTRPRRSTPTGPRPASAPEATAFAKETLAGKPVTLELDPTQDRRDRFDRLLAHVHVGDTLYAAEAIAAGYGIHYIYEVPSIHAAELAAAEASAKAANLGIWASCEGRVDLPLSAVADPRRARRPRLAEPPAGSNATPRTRRACPNAGHDLDCKDIGFMVTIIGPDEYRLDGSDHDGKGCESYR